MAIVACAALAVTAFSGCGDDDDDDTPDGTTPAGETVPMDSTMTSTMGSTMTS